MNMPLAAQPVCPTGFPSTDSPVASLALDDIPATNIDIVTYTGATAKARANHRVSYVQINENDQRVWFGVDSSPGLYRIFYNRRMRADVNSPWQWQYSSSPMVIQFPSPASVMTGSVLYSPTTRYRDTVSNQTYKFLMYQVYQPGACDGIVAGFLYLSFSNDGICWTAPRAARRSANPEFSCAPSLIDPVPVEAVSAVDSGQAVYLVAMEGDVAWLLSGDVFAQDARFEQSVTSLADATYSNPGQITFIGTSPDLSARGLYIPRTGPAHISHPQRYEPYRFLLDVDIAFDAASGDIYMGRAYPYPFDRGTWYYDGYSADLPIGTNVPTSAQKQQTTISGSPVIGCPDGIALFPNRVQVYKMNIGTYANILKLTGNYTWDFLGDFGGAAGYNFRHYATTSPALWWQTNTGADYGSIAFLRDGAGNLVRDNGTARFFAGEIYKKSKSGSNPCQVTGTERNFVLNVPW